MQICCAKGTLKEGKVRKRPEPVGSGRLSVLIKQILVGTITGEKCERGAASPHFRV